MTIFCYTYEKFTYYVIHIWNMTEWNARKEIKRINKLYRTKNTFNQWESTSLDLDNVLILIIGVEEIFPLLKHLYCQSTKVVWPSGLRRWFKAPISSEARVRISSLSFLFQNISDAKLYSGSVSIG